MNGWCACIGEGDFHHVSAGRSRCGLDVEPTEYMGAAYMGLRCGKCVEALERELVEATGRAA